MVGIRKLPALLALSVVAIAACGGGSSSNNSNTSPFVLGVVLSWSGAFGTRLQS